MAAELAKRLAPQLGELNFYPFSAGAVPSRPSPQWEGLGPCPSPTVQEGKARPGGNLIKLGQGQSASPLYYWREASLGFQTAGTAVEPLLHPQ